MSPRMSLRRSQRSEQKGVVLFVALIAMVILSLAGVALMRSVDTSTGVAGNLAFRQASFPMVNQAIEESINAIYKAKTLPTQLASHAPSNYYASIQPGESKTGVPSLLAGDYNTMKAAYTAAGFTTFPDAVSGGEVRWVIERVCNADGGVTIAKCDILPPKVSQAGTDNKAGIPLPPIPLFRITVRADIPNTNAISIAQGFVK
jgi:type IV pilus assembly protein PilX